MIIYECNHCKDRFRLKRDCVDHIRSVHYRLFGDDWRFAKFDLNKIVEFSPKVKTNQEKRKIEKEFEKIGATPF